MTPAAARSFPVALVALAVWSAAVVGCGNDRSAEPPSGPSASISSSVPDPTGAPPSSTAPTTTTRAPEGVVLGGLVTAIEPGAPAALDCDAPGSHEATAFCPPPGDEVLGSVTIDGTVVLVTEATDLQTCGPTDGAVAIAFGDVNELLAQVTSLDARATVVDAPSDSSPGWARATGLFLGSCG